MTKKSIGITAAVVVAAGIGAAIIFNQPASVEPFCYRNQAGTLVHTNHSLANRTFGAPMGAHGTAAIGEDGILYGLFDQCPTSGPETRYQRPQASAGARVIRWWEWYWTHPNAKPVKQPDGKWASNRCFAIPPGRELPEFPPDSVPSCTSLSAGCAVYTVQSGTFAPRVTDCGPVTPGPTVPPPGPTTPPGPCPPCPCLTPGVTAPPIVLTPTRPVPTPPVRPTRVAEWQQRQGIELHSQSIECSPGYMTPFYQSEVDACEQRLAIKQQTDEIVKLRKAIERGQESAKRPDYECRAIGNAHHVWDHGDIRSGEGPCPPRPFRGVSFVDPS